MITTELKRLGGLSANTIAALLYSAGFRAPLDSAVFNPLAQWLEYYTERPLEYIAVTEEKLHILTTDGETYTIDLPQTVSEFVQQFNAGVFPELEGVPYNEPPAERETPQEAQALA